MKTTILKSIQNFRQFSIGAQIVPLMAIIMVSNNLLSNNSPDVNTYMSHSKDHYLEFSGRVKEAKNWEYWPLENIENAEILIFSKEYKVIGTLLSGNEGMCHIKLPLNDQFILMVSKMGYITKTIDVDTRIDETKMANYHIDFEIDMFEDIAGIDVNVLTKSVANVCFNNHLSCFDYDFKATDAINAKLKRKYLMYYAYHPEKGKGYSYQPVNKNKIKGNSYQPERKTKTYSQKVKETNTTGIAKNTPANIKPKQTTQIRKSGPTTKSYVEFGKGTTVKNGNSPLNDGVSANQKNKSVKNEITGKVDLVNIDSSDIVFRIQISSIKEYLSPGAKLFEKFGKVNEYVHNGKNKYTIGEFKTFGAANVALSEINVNGYKDAILVAFLKGQRITVDAAKSAKFTESASED